MTPPTADDALDARIDALEQSRDHRTPSGRQLDGRAADDAWGHDDAWVNAREAIAAAKAHIAGEGQ